MDYQINLIKGQGIMSLNTKNSDIRTSIYLSINIQPGDWFMFPDFGMKRITKITAANILLQKQYVTQALDWMIKAGKATSFDITVEQDTFDVSRINISVIGRQPNGFVVTYEQFMMVGGAGTNASTDVWYNSAMTTTGLVTA